MSASPVFQDKSSFIVSRCVDGPQGWKGLFQVSEVEFNDKAGKPLKKPIRKVLKSGVDLFLCVSAMNEALHKRIYR